MSEHTAPVAVEWSHVFVVLGGLGTSLEAYVARVCTTREAAEAWVESMTSRVDTPAGYYDVTEHVVSPD